MSADDDQDRLRFERIKLEVDVIKHISTLSVGSIVLIVTLIDKLPKPSFLPSLVMSYCH